MEARREPRALRSDVGLGRVRLGVLTRANLEMVKRTVENNGESLIRREGA